MNISIFKLKLPLLGILWNIYEDITKSTGLYFVKTQNLEKKINLSSSEISHYLNYVKLLLVNR